MELNRRRAVQLGTAATFGAALPSSAITNPDPNRGFEAAHQNTIARLKSVFSELGFAETPPLSIVTADDTYNGGLRHDFDQSTLPPEAFVVQPLARVGDVAEKDRPDILPLFHEIGCHPAHDTDGQVATRLMVRTLTDTLGLDPARIAFVSVPQSTNMRPVLDELGLSFPEKVLLRDEVEALAARDASGYFFPDPFGEDYLVTMGVYYRVGDTDEAAPAAYPPTSSWTEIGEIVIAGDAAPLGISLGAERLTFALTGLYPTWDQRLALLFAQVDHDSAGGLEPPGLAAFR
ncbi:hypothetical protein [Ruegeria sp. EL01]|uniref:hypothetical protein n=1 Tax=Ruegeria sp. EL01 TaxID=2107578 RepID=UPI0013C47E72|nr:hypothetical protein [Ruegeria sp. EL01]